MACGCANVCACDLAGGDGIAVTGYGTSTTPYTIGLDLGTSGDGCEQVMDCVGANSGDGLVYSSGSTTLEVRLSADDGNALKIGSDGGVYGTGGDAGLASLAGTSPIVVDGSNATGYTVSSQGPRARFSLTTATIPNNELTRPAMTALYSSSGITYSAASADTRGLVVAEAGIYALTLSIRWFPSATTGKREIFIMRSSDSSPYTGDASWSAGANQFWMSCSTEVALAAGEEVAFGLLQLSGASLGFNSGNATIRKVSGLVSADDVFAVDEAQDQIGRAA